MAPGSQTRLLDLDLVKQPLPQSLPETRTTQLFYLPFLFRF
jgi:hypothetical protein